MFDHDKAYALGQSRYGITNESVKKCACGESINPRSRQLFVEPMCDDCLAEERETQKREVKYERENAMKICEMCGTKVPDDDSRSKAEHVYCRRCDPDFDTRGK